MCRSVMIKGLEALLLESLLAARHYGVEQAVLDSLSRPVPAEPTGTQLPRYMISRALEQGGAAPRRCARWRAPSPKPASRRS